MDCGAQSRVTPRGRSRSREAQQQPNVCRPSGRTAAEVAANVERHVAAIQSKRIRSLHLILWVVEYLLPLTTLRWRFSRMSRPARRRLIERRITGRMAPLRTLSKVKVLFLAGYYDDERAHADIGVRRARTID